MENAEIITSWTVDRKPQVAADYAITGACSDATGQAQENVSPDPNVLVVAVTAETAVLDQIEADLPGSILWREVIENEA